MTKFFICKTCGNIIMLVNDNGGPLACCGTDMTYLEPNTVEASTEKHLPDITKTDNGLIIKVGSVLHPMEIAHYIDFIYVKTENGGHLINLKIGDDPEVEINLENDEPIEVYAYCNLHGMWKTVC